MQFVTKVIETKLQSGTINGLDIRITDQLSITGRNIFQNTRSKITRLLMILIYKDFILR